MVSRTLPTSLILSLALVGTACGDSAVTDASSTFSGGTGATSDTGMNNTETGDTMNGDGDPTGDGDGDTAGDGDGDPAGDGDGDSGDGDGDSGDGDGDTGEECLDLDQDGFGSNCPMGTDCDDADFNVFSVNGCANCSDNDNDNVWVGCDQYGDLKPGPDCDDENDNVGLDDAEEICNGLAENCAGEIDNAPASEMCPPEGVVAPNVSPMNGWSCNPPAPGQDGCVITGCVEQYYNLDNNVGNGCECQGTSRTASLAACSDAPQGFLGAIGESEQLQNAVIGTIPQIDNLIGNGREDWFSVNFEENDAAGIRPNTGSIRVSFALNEGNDYRFEVYRSCQGVAFAGNLATQHGVGSPPSREWWFFDNHAAPTPVHNVAWPNKAYIRVFRVQNDNTCNNYQLSVSRVDN